MVEAGDSAATKSSGADGRAATPPARATYCSDCTRHFSSTARFCPFDGTLLVQSQRVAMADPLLGQLIDSRYDVIRVLGEGGMGIVYEVRHQLLGRHLALKVLRSELARDSKLCQRFIREARAAAKVEHPNVVRITDFGALPSGQPYFVMELLRGESLTRVMNLERPMSLERFVPIVEQLIDALSAAHSVDVVHRDLKPDNIQILREGSGAESVKIVDFGLARVAGASRLTKQGFVFGTPHYMSPEQAHGDAVDHRADIYALGVLMYEMLTGQLPFDADSYTGVLAKHIYEPPLHPSKLVGRKALGALEPLILRCLEKKPHRRHPSVSLVGNELRAAIRRTETGIQVVRRRLRTKRLPEQHVPLQEISTWARAGLYIRSRSLGWFFVAGAATLFALLAWGIGRWSGEPSGASEHMAPPLAPSQAAPQAIGTVSQKSPPRVSSRVHSSLGPEPTASAVADAMGRSGKLRRSGDSGRKGNSAQARSGARSPSESHGLHRRAPAPPASSTATPTWVTRQQPDEAQADSGPTRTWGAPDIVDPWTSAPAQ